MSFIGTPAVAGVVVVSLVVAPLVAFAAIIGEAFIVAIIGEAFIVAAAQSILYANQARSLSCASGRKMREGESAEQSPRLTTGLRKPPK